MNVLYALAGRRDKHHSRCASWLQRRPDVLMVPATVLAESCCLIDKTLGPAAEAASGIAGIDSSGRICERAIITALGWAGGDRLTFTGGDLPPG